MTYGMFTGALSRGRSTLVCFSLALAVSVIALVIGSSNADAAFTANGYSLGAVPTQAGAHPTITLSASNDPVAADANGDDLKSLKFELPAGMLINPQAVSTPCPTATFNADGCAAATQVGSISVTFRVAGKLTTATGQVYSITPDATSLINLGFIVRPSSATNFQKFSFTSGPVTGLAVVRPSPDADYGLSIPIPTIPRVIKTKYGTNSSMTISNLAVTFNPRSGTATSGITFDPFSYAPPRCTPANSKVAFTSYANVTATRTASYTPTGCDKLDFNPGFVVASSYPTVNRPSGFSTTVYMPDADGDLPIQPPHIKDVIVNLATGTTINPSTTLTVPPCTEDLLAADTCPATSKIGAASAAVPLLAAGMSGDIYLTGLTAGVQFAIVLRGERGTKSILRGSFAVETSTSAGSRVVIRYTTLPQVPASIITLDLTKRMINNSKNECPNASGWGDLKTWSGHRSLYGVLYPQTGCPPETTLTSTTPSVINTRTPTFTFTGSPASSTFECSVDYATYTSCVSGFKTASLTDGPHTFGVRAVYDGVSDPSPAQRGFTVDATAPTLSLTFPVTGDVFATGELTAIFSLSSDATGMCAIDSATPTPCTSPATITGITPGARTFSIFARDAAGNVSRTFTRDIKVASANGPKVTITTPQPGATLLTDELVPEFNVTSPVGSAITSTQCRVYSLQFKPSINTYLETLVNESPCSSGASVDGYTTGQLYRLKLVATDATGDVGIATADFIPAISAPAPPSVVNDVMSGSLSDRTPSFELLYYDEARWPNVDIECAIARKGEAPIYAPCGTSANLPDYAVTDPLTNGEWSFYTRSRQGLIVGSPYKMNFTVGEWSAIYTATTSTQKAGAHPDLDVDITPTGAGQFRSVDLTLPKGLIGSLNSFPKCADTVKAICDANTKIGTVMVDYGIAGLSSLAPTPGDVFLTGPQGPNDAAGMVIRVYGPIDPYADVIIPLHLELTNNAQTMRVYSNSIPTVVGDLYDPELFTNFWVYNFKMHVNGSAGSPYPLLTNPSSCAAGQFSGVFGDTEGTKTSAATIPYQATDCASLPFNPTIAQTFSSTEAGTLSGISANVTIPENNSSFKSLRVLEPSIVGPNFPSFGSTADQCSAAAAPTGNSTFDPSLCPDAAKVGTMSIVSPLLEEPLEGTVYLINKSPLPWLGVALDGVGIHVRLIGVTGLPQVDPSCDPSTSDTGECPKQISVTFSNLPDLQATNISFAINGPDRTGAGGASLSGKILTLASPSDPTCVASDVARATITPNSGSAAVAAVQPFNFSGCQTP